MRQLRRGGLPACPDDLLARLRRHVRLVRRRGRGRRHRTSPLACAEFRRGIATRPSRSSSPRTYIVASPQNLSTERSIDGPTTSLLFRGGLIVTQDSERRVVSGDVLVEEGRIVSVGSSDLSADEVIDCTRCAIVPGLINLHNHVPNTLLRGVKSGGRLPGSAPGPPPGGRPSSGLKWTSSR